MCLDQGFSQGPQQQVQYSEVYGWDLKCLTDVSKGFWHLWKKDQWHCCLPAAHLVLQETQNEANSAECYTDNLPVSTAEIDITMPKAYN